MEKIRVLVVDDQDIVRQGLKIITEHQPDMSVIGQAADGEESVRMAAVLKPDVVLMDIKMPHMSGIEATRKITEGQPQTQVIILTTYDADDLVFEGIRAGAQGFLLKDAGSEAILDAVRAVHRGESQLDPQIARKVMNEFRRVVPPAEPAPADDGGYEALSEREMEVLGLLAKGMNSKEIAGALFLSDGTVRNYVSSILSKLHANDRTQAVIKAARCGMVRL
ncbi:MAG: response regulator transcription factor [Chloroflexi bacterium]|nr:response regulator transcription factor [Chloroflexota bacterium]